MKKLFPLFKEHSQLHYFDSAATTIKPQSIIDAMAIAYAKYTIPIEKGLYQEAENYYEELIIPLKLKLQLLFNAIEFEIFFGHSVTILLHQVLELCLNNLLNNKNNIKIILPETLHNSFFMPLQKYKHIIYYYYNQSNIKDILSKNKFDIIYIPIIDHITGEEINYKDLIEYKKKNNEVIIIADASQSGMYQNEDLSNNLFDFFLLSSHKMYGPEGLAILLLSKQLFLKYKIFNTLSLYLLKGFFAQGSLPYTAYYGFLKALEFLEKNIYYNENYKKQQFQFLQLIYEEAQKNRNLIVISQTNHKTIITFYHKNIYAHDVAINFSKRHICVRSGDLCSPFIAKNNRNGLVRISFGCYIEEEDVQVIKKAMTEI